jgi:hypothetical protein
MRLRDLLMGDTAGALVGSPEMDPLTEKDALQEARLNELLFDAVNRRVGLLFDLRGSVQLRMAYTGLLVLGGVEGLSWTSERRPSTRTAWNVVGSLPVNEDGVINLRLFFFPDAELTVVARSAAFYAGDVPGLPDTPPDFADSDEAVAAGMASLDSPFEPTQATVIRLRSLRRWRRYWSMAGPVRFVVQLHDATTLHFNWPCTTGPIAGGMRTLQERAEEWARVLGAGRGGSRQRCIYLARSPMTIGVTGERVIASAGPGISQPSQQAAGPRPGARRTRHPSP